MAWVVLGALLLFLSVVFAQYFATASARSIANMVRIAGAVLLAVLSLPIWLRMGGLSGLPVLILGLLLVMGWPRFLFRRRYGGRAGGSSSGTASGSQSRVQTPSLTMVLDHDSGAMDGEIRVAPYAGRRLSGLSVEELGDFLSFCQQSDSQAAALLETYIERHRKAEWRAYEARSDRAGRSDRGASRPPSEDAAMSVAQAYEILGLDETAGLDEIKQRHRELMKKLHPDHGGSSYLARQINQAKQMLEDRRRTAG